MPTIIPGYSALKSNELGTRGIADALKQISEDAKKKNYAQQATVQRLQTLADRGVDVSKMNIHVGPEGQLSSEDKDEAGLARSFQMQPDLLWHEGKGTQIYAQELGDNRKEAIGLADRNAARASQTPGAKAVNNAQTRVANTASAEKDAVRNTTAIPNTNSALGLAQGLKDIYNTPKNGGLNNLMPNGGLFADKSGLLNGSQPQQTPTQGAVVAPTTPVTPTETNPPAGGQVLTPEIGRMGIEANAKTQDNYGYNINGGESTVDINSTPSVKTTTISDPSYGSDIPFNTMDLMNNANAEGINANVAGVTNNGTYKALAQQRESDFQNALKEINTPSHSESIKEGKFDVRTTFKAGSIGENLSHAVQNVSKLSINGPGTAAKDKMIEDTANGIAGDTIFRHTLNGQQVEDAPEFTSPNSFTTQQIKNRINNSGKEWTQDKSNPDLFTTSKGSLMWKDKVDGKWHLLLKIGDYYNHASNILGIGHTKTGEVDKSKSGGLKQKENK